MNGAPTGPATDVEGVPVATDQAAAAGRHPSHDAVAEGGFEAFFRAAFPKAVAVARRVTGERASAEDAAVEALAKAHLRWRRLAGEPWREAWVLRVAVNEAIRRLPRRPPGDRAGAADPAVDHAGVGDPAADHADLVVLRQTLAAAIGRLSRRQREVVVLRHLVGLSEAQVAEALDISPGTVKTHLRRAMSDLRRTVGDNVKEAHRARLA